MEAKAPSGSRRAFPRPRQRQVWESGGRHDLGSRRRRFHEGAHQSRDNNQPICAGTDLDSVWRGSQEKIAKSLLPHAIALSNNQYGRFFYKRLNLPLYESRPKEWREVQLKVVHHFYGPKTAVGEAAVRATKTETAAVEATSAGKSEAEADGDSAPVTTGEGDVKPVKKEKKDKKSKKRTRDSEDEIDDLFADVVSDKKKKKKKSKQT